MARIIVLLGAPPARDRVRGALSLEAAAGVFHQLRCVSGWGRLREEAEASSLAVAVVDPYLEGNFRGVELRDLRRDYPSIPVIAYGDLNGRPGGQLLDLARSGVAELVALGVDDGPSFLQRALIRAVGRSDLNWLLERAGAEFEPQVVEMLRRTLDLCSSPASARDLARACNVSIRTLERRLHAAGLPSPKRLLRWMRLLHAGQLMADPARSVNSVALSLGFSSSSSLRRILKHNVGLTPSELAEAGGVRYLVDAFFKRTSLSRKAS